MISSSPEHVLKVFSHLMLKGQLRSAVRWVTERMHTGGVLHPSDVVENGSKSVLEVLENKHPEPSGTGADAFMPCDTLPPLIEVDITGSHVERVARGIQGSAGPGGTNAAQ